MAIPKSRQEDKFPIGSFVECYYASKWIGIVRGYHWYKYSYKNDNHECLLLIVTQLVDAKGKLLRHQKTICYNSSLFLKVDKPAVIDFPTDCHRYPRLQAGSGFYSSSNFQPYRE